MGDPSQAVFYKTPWFLEATMWALYALRHSATMVSLSQVLMMPLIYPMCALYVSVCPVSYLLHGALELLYLCPVYVWYPLYMPSRNLVCSQASYLPLIYALYALYTTLFLVYASYMTLFLVCALYMPPI